MIIPPGYIPGFFYGCARHYYNKASIIPKKGQVRARQKVRIVRNGIRCGPETRGGLVARDADSAWLDFDPEQASPIDNLAGRSIAYRIAVGPKQGREAFTLQTLPAWEDEGGECTALVRASGRRLPRRCGE
jgi:hypothetical protein